MLKRFFVRQTRIDVDDNTSGPFDDVQDANNMHRIDEIRLNDMEVKYVLLSLDPGKATGPDGISNKILSSLNNHLFLKNIVDSPNCVCGENETNHHYVFECTLYIRQIPSSVCLQTLLFVDDSQSLKDNKRVFEAVHSFIIASKRFN